MIQVISRKLTHYMGACPHRRHRADPEPEPAPAARAAFGVFVEHRGVYRDPRTGHTIVQSRRARRRFQTAVRRVTHWLLLRKRWSAIGRLLQQQPRADLWVGLRRVGGNLQRHAPAPING